MTREEQMLNGFTEMMRGFWNNQDLKVPDIETLKSKMTPEEHTTCKQESCEDCISRQSALDKAFEIKTGKYTSAMVVYAHDIRILPPVTPQPKTGHWIYEDALYSRCSKCGEHAIIANWLKVLSDYCPNCGCRMVEPQESEGKE